MTVRRQMNNATRGAVVLLVPAAVLLIGAGMPDQAERIVNANCKTRGDLHEGSFLLSGIVKMFSSTLLGHAEGSNVTALADHSQ